MQHSEVSSSVFICNSAENNQQNTFSPKTLQHYPSPNNQSCNVSPHDHVSSQIAQRQDLDDEAFIDELLAVSCNKHFVCFLKVKVLKTKFFVW